VHDPELVDSTGTVVPTSVATFSTGSALIPVSTLAPGGYRLRRYVNCNVPTPTTQEQSFTVTAAAAQPSEVGTVEVAPAQIATYTVSTFTGSCTAQVPVSLVKLTFKASADFAPFLPVAKLAVDVDGVNWASSEWGGAESSIPKSFYWAPHVYDELFTNCEASPLPYDDAGLSEGKHTATLKVWLPTQNQPLASLPFEFTTSCADVVLPDGGVRPDGAVRDAQPASLDAKASTPDIAEAVPEAGSPDTSAQPDARGSISLDLGSGGSVGTADSAAVAADAAGTPPRTSSGGCSCSTSRNSNWPGVLLALAAVCAIRLRRARGSVR
jgi:MYXO-CTERM domain-containing protein